MANWEEAMEFIARHEWGNQPDGDPTTDTGGFTKYGISQKANPDIDVPNLTLEQAKEVYNKRYWIQMGCHEIRADDVALAIFDTAINCGNGAAAKWWRESNGDIDVFLFDRENHYRFLSLKPQFAPYLKGWLNRLDDLRKEIRYIQNKRETI